MNLSPETIAHLRKIRQEAQAKRVAKAVAQARRKANKKLNSAEAALKRKRASMMKDMTYSKYLENKKTITTNLAPATATPKMTKGDSHRHRFILETLKRRNIVSTSELTIPRRGYLVKKI